VSEPISVAPTSSSRLHRVPQTRAPDIFRAGESLEAPQTRPLFPDEKGQAVEKEAMADTIRAAAGHLNIALASLDLTEQVTGHSLRAT
jgi:hypothetical protein